MLLDEAVLSEDPSDGLLLGKYFELAFSTGGELLRLFDGDSSSSPELVRSSWSTGCARLLAPDEGTIYLLLWLLIEAAFDRADPYLLNEGCLFVDGGLYTDGCLEDSGMSSSTPELTILPPA